MKMISTLAAGAALSAMVATGALASDLNGGSLKDGPAVNGGGVVNWTGFYIGGSLGYGNANHNLSLEEYHGAYCWDRDGTQDPVQPEDSYNPWDGAFDGHAEELNADGSCGGNAVLGTETGPYRNGNTKPHGNGATAQTNAWDEGDHATVDGNSREVIGLDGVNSSGLVGDGRIGFDMQRGRFVGGIFASYGFNDMSTTLSIAGTNINAIEKNDEWSVGARAGILVNPRTLAYILAAYTESEFSFAGLGDSGGNKEVNFSGVTVGGGVEFAMTNNVFLGIEGTHTFYGSEKIWDSGTAAGDPTGHGIRLNDEIGETKVMGTLKIKLNSGLGNVID